MDFSIPLGGLQTADAAFQSAASAITQAFEKPVNSPAAGAGDSVDLSTQVAALLKSKLDFEANTKLTIVENAMQQSTFSILG